MAYRKDMSKASRKANNLHYIRNTIVAVFFIVLASALCWLLGFMQNRASELKQKENSEKVLVEIAQTLQDNSDTVEVIDDEFDTMNQNLIVSLANYLNYADVLGKARSVDTSDPESLQRMTTELCNLFLSMKESINAGEIYLVDDAGTVLIASTSRFVGRNISSAFSEQDRTQLLRYSDDVIDGYTFNGTMSVREDGERNANHVLAGEYYTYSTLLGREHGATYFLLTSIPTDLLDSEIAGLKKIENVLDGVSVGKSGFLFAIDNNTGKFIYFNNGATILSGEDYGMHGLSERAEEDAYSGYETIDGVSYYCVTKEFKSSTFGDYTIIAAAESKDALLSKNISTVAFSGVAFILVSALVLSYALILRRDVANRTIALRNKFTSDYEDDIHDGKFSLTEEEIQERVEIRVEDARFRQTDKRFKHINIGTRNRRGAQTYLSLYIFGKLIPVAVIGLAFIFGISFFSQTLISLEDVTNMSESRINDIPAVMAQADKTKEFIQSYVSRQYVSTAKLLSYIFEESPDGVFGFSQEDSEAHRFFYRDDAGERVYLKDMYGNDRYSLAYSVALQSICDDNGLDSLYVFDEDGNVIATNTEYWYFSLSRNPENQSYPFWDVLDGKVQSYAQDPTEEEVSGRLCQYVGNAFYYYTYKGSDGLTHYVDKDAYADFLNGEWTDSPITKHRGMVQIGINRDELSSLFRITGIDYVLGGMRVYGSDSFFVAFDNSDEHKVVYSPNSSSIGKESAALGVMDNVFSGDFNGFQKVNGIKYYQSYRQEGSYFVSTAIPVNTLYGARNAISGYTLLFSALFVLFVSIIYSLSSDQMDRDYAEVIRTRDKYSSTSSESFYITSASGRRRKTSSAESRFKKVSWNDKSPEQKLSALLLGAMTLASVMILVILVLSLTNSVDGSIFDYIFRGNWEKGWNIFAFTEALMIMVIIMTVTKLVQISVRSFCGSLGARVETTGNLLVSVLKYGGMIGGFFYCLHLFGFNSAGLITSAGILSIVIGLGAQSLISDIIAGIFIVFEGEFRVGDIVTIGDFRGSVLEIGLRTTKVEDVTKNIKIFNNSSISGVINMTKEASFASLIVSIEYGESLERVEKVLKDSFPRIRKNLPKIIDGPFYLGVSELASNSVDLRISAQCEEKDRMQLVRDLNREIYLIFNKNNINVPFPQVTVSYLEEGEKVQVSAKDAKEARAFVESQWDSMPEMLADDSTMGTK